MSDLISRQAAIDAILHNQEVYSNNFGDDPIDKYTIAIISNDVQTIVQLPSAPQWIPCSERLPEKYGNYLITTYDGDVDIGTIDPNRKNVWSSCDADGFYWVRNVIAWMPLPEPYKEVTE